MSLAHAPTHRPTVGSGPLLLMVRIYLFLGGYATTGYTPAARG